MLLLSCNFSSTSKTEATETDIKFTETKIQPTTTNTPEIKEWIYDESTSPSGEWNATVTVVETSTIKEIKLVVSNKSTGQKWIITESNSDEITTPILYSLYPYIFKWSNDKKFLYFSYLWDRNDGCFGYFKPGGFGLKRLDLSTGQIDTIREDKSTWMTFSPDEKQLAYIDTFDGNISIYDLENNNEQTYLIPSIDTLGMYPETNNLYWSPDGNSLIYGRYIGKCDLLEPFLYVIQLYPDTGQQIILLDKKEGYYLVEWSVKDKILLKDNEDRLYFLNSNSKELIPAN